MADESMKATKELREMLDGWHIEYSVEDGDTVKLTKWMTVGGIRYTFAEHVSGIIKIKSDFSEHEMSIGEIDAPEDDDWR